MGAARKDLARSNGGGLATLDLAVMHERALIALAPSHDFTNVRKGFIKRAGIFFTQALVPLEAAQHAERKTSRMLEQRNEALIESNSRLELEIKRRKAAEEVVLKSREEYHTLLLESQAMQKKLRQLTARSSQRKKKSGKRSAASYNDEVVQTLVGINVQLSALGKEASVGSQFSGRKLPARDGSWKFL